MDKPTPKERIEHVLKAISNIHEFTDGSSAEVFATDDKLQSAVLWQFLIIGEAIRHVDGTILDRYAYPWHIPRSFRNFITHKYNGIKMDRIYFATKDLDALEKVMQEILQNEF